MDKSRGNGLDGDLESFLFWIMLLVSHWLNCLVRAFFECVHVFIYRSIETNIKEKVSRILTGVNYLWLWKKATLELSTWERANSGG